jgi:peptidoglycan hydrolase-like protein with peptidoglycan-binding domain
MKKYLGPILAGVMVGVALIPLAASAQSVTDLQSQIKTLMSQIKVLQEKIHSIHDSATTTVGDDRSNQSVDITADQHNNDNQGTSPMNCPELKRDLSIGSRGDDVRAIQGVLAQDPTIFAGTTTGFFGTETAKGMMRFQKKFGIASSSTGFVGKLTREFFGKKCPPAITKSTNGGKNERSMDTRRRVSGGVVSANSGTTLSITAMDGSTKTVNLTVNTVFLKWVGTTSPVVVAVASDVTVGSFIIVEGREVSMGVFTATTVRIGFPMPPKDDQGRHDDMRGGQMMRGDTHIGTSTMSMTPEPGDHGGDRMHQGMGSSTDRMMPSQGGQDR